MFIGSFRQKRGIGKGFFGKRTYYNHRFLAARSDGYFLDPEAALALAQSRGALAGSARMTGLAIPFAKKPRTGQT
jgi:hypothetical protein